jgi:hypothetical protein
MVTVEVCTGQDFGILGGLVGGAFGRNTKFIFKYTSRNAPKRDLFLFEPEWSPIYLDSALTIVSFIRVSFSA